MENIDLSALKKVAEARVAEEEQRAKAHQPHPNGGMTGAAAVSYTHLTLPTILLV